jgi:hypothetical protein
MTPEHVIMTKSEILEGLTVLDLTERLAIIEDALHSVREELARRRADAVDADRTARLAAAAASLLPDYEAGGELTAFTSLDAEPVHAPG